jgi:hypothetical protein
LAWLNDLAQAEGASVLVFDAYGRPVPDGAGENPKSAQARFDNLAKVLESPVAGQ